MSNKPPIVPNLFVANLAIMLNVLSSTPPLFAKLDALTLSKIEGLLELVEGYRE